MFAGFHIETDQTFPPSGGWNEALERIRSHEFQTDRPKEPKIPGGEFDELRDSRWTSLSGADWAVLALYFVVVAALGGWVGRDQKDTDDYLLGGRAIPWWAALLSLVATEISAATFLGAPEQGYRRNLTYLQFAMGGIAARCFLANYFISVYYRAGVTTVYEFLKTRFGSGTQQTTAALFLFGRILADGSRLFIAAITIEVITGFPISWSIVILTVTTVCYTASGGIKAVIWTDVLQAFILVGAGVVLFIALYLDCGLSLSEIVQQLQASDKLKVLEFSGDPVTDQYHFLPAVIGGFFLTMATHGTDHDMVQRLLTCRDDAGSRRSTWMSGFVGISVTILFLMIGLLLFLQVENSQPGSPLSEKARELAERGNNGHYLLYYAKASLPQGVFGLVIAGILAAAMSSLSSAFNAMTATFISDFYRPMTHQRSPHRELIVSRLVTVVCSLLIAGLALLVAYYNQAHPEVDLLSLALGVMTFFYGGLLGIFLVALFSRDRGRTSSNLAAAILSTVAVILLKSYTNVAWPWFIVIGTTVSVLVSASLPTRNGGSEEESVGALTKP